MSFLENDGVIVGVALLALVTLWAILLGRKAARTIGQFRDEHHETFTGTKKE